MKSVMFAAAAAAAVASAHQARSPLDLGIKVPDLLDVKVCLGLDIKLPLGISADSAGCPDGPPADDETDVWHPAHHVPMDGCDNVDNLEWHYVHPCDCEAESPHTWGVAVATKVINSCAPTVTDCPEGHVATVTTYNCPLPATASSNSTSATPTMTTVLTPPVVAAFPTPCTEAPMAPVVDKPVVDTHAAYPQATLPVGTGTGFFPIANSTQAPVMAGAPKTSHTIGAVIAIGLAAVLLI